jgi:erythromycin esterase
VNVIKEIGISARPLNGSTDLDALIEQVGDARFVLLGEASHGTHEYYTWRAAISKRLIEEKGFSLIAVEGDWPDCFRINRFIKGHDDEGSTAVDVLRSFRRWPTWMWANWEIVAFVEWMQQHNKKSPASSRVGFYGLDVYSLWESMELIVQYLRKEDPSAAKVAVQALRCFEPYEEGQDYARAMLQLSPHCQDEVLRLLTEVRKRSSHYDHDLEAALNTEMNARVIANAEKYYRSMVSFRDESWNIRDTHMAETLNVLMKYHGKKSKAIVWEHNTHIGDARFTDMRDEGLVNVGQLLREQHGNKDGVYVVGFASYEGFVIAGRIWGGKMQEMTVPPAVEGSVEEMLHQEFHKDVLMLFDEDKSSGELTRAVPHRAIGVVYHPESERGNYVPSQMTSRYDALLYFEKSKALHPLHIKPEGTKIPETFPFGL